MFELSNNGVLTDFSRFAVLGSVVPAGTKIGRGVISDGYLGRGLNAIICPVVEQTPIRYAEVNNIWWVRTTQDNKGVQ
jgi:hypothetical protein